MVLYWATLHCYEHIIETITEAAILRLERSAFMTLVRQPATLARVAHTLKTGKPLRN